MEIFRMAPRFRYGEMTPWGGDNLRLYFGKDAPADRVGESLEVSALPNLESIIHADLMRERSLSFSFQ